MKIAINKNNDIVMNKTKDSEVFVCDNKGNLKHKFKQESNELWSLNISNKNEIMISSKDFQAVLIYSEEGNPKSTINLPEGHFICGVAFHFAFSKIIVLTYVMKKIHISFCATLKKVNWRPQRSFVKMKCQASHLIQVVILLL